MIENVYEKYKSTLQKGQDKNIYWISITVEEPEYAGVVEVRSNRPSSLDEKYFDILFQRAFETKVIANKLTDDVKTRKVSLSLQEIKRVLMK